MDQTIIDQSKRLAAEQGYDLEVRTVPVEGDRPPSDVDASFELWKDGELVGPAGSTVAAVIEALEEARRD